MSFRNRKALAGVMAAMLFATCFMFMIPESSDAVMAPAETVVIESDMDDDLPLSDIVLQYSAISAEKEHQESMGKTVIIRDNEPKRDDPKEQKFIDDMRSIFGMNKDPSPAVKNDSPYQTMMINQEPSMKMVQTPVPIPIQPVEAVSPAEPTKIVSEPAEADIEDTTAETSEETTEVSEDVSAENTVTASELSVIDVEFIQSAIDLAIKNGVQLDMDPEYFVSFQNRIATETSYSELKSADTTSKDEEETDDDAVIFEEEDEEEETVLIPDEPKVIQDLFSAPVTGESVADALCSGTDI